MLPDKTILNVDQANTQKDVRYYFSMEPNHTKQEKNNISSVQPLLVPLALVLSINLIKTNYASSNPEFQN